MNKQLDNSHSRSMSTDSMPSNISEDFSSLHGKIASLQLDSHEPLDKKVLFNFNQSIRTKVSQTQTSQLHTHLISPSNQEKRNRVRVQSDKLTPPKVHIPYESCQKKVIKEQQTGGPERQTFSFGEFENTVRVTEKSHSYGCQNLRKNHVNRLPLEMPLQISPKPGTTLDLHIKSQTKSDINRQSKSFDEGFAKQKTSGNGGLQNLQSPKNFAYCFPKVISVDKANENFLSERMSQMNESNIEIKNSLNASLSLMREDNPKARISPNQSMKIKLLCKEEFNFSNVLLGAEKKLNQTQQKSTSRFSPKKEVNEIYFNETDILTTLHGPSAHLGAEKENNPEKCIATGAFTSNSQMGKEGVKSVPQSLRNTKPIIQIDKENEASKGSSVPKGRKSTKNIWNNYTEQLRKEMKQKPQVKENKEFLFDTLFDFNNDSHSNMQSSGLESNISNFDRPTAGNSKPSTFYSIQDERQTEKPQKRHLKKDLSRDSLEISLPLQLDNSRSRPSVLSEINREKPRGSVESHQGKSNEQFYKTSSTKRIMNKRNTLFLADDREKLFAKDDSLQTNGQVTIEPDYKETEQSSSSVKSKKDEDLSEFIRIEMGLSQEEQVFQSPCLIRTSSLLKKGVSRSLKDVEDSDKVQEQEEKHQADSINDRYLTKTANQQLINYNHQNSTNRSSIGQEGSCNSLNETNRISEHLDITDSIIRHNPKMLRRTGSSIQPRRGNFVKSLNTSNITMDNRNEMNSALPNMPFEALTHNIMTNRKMIDLLNRKNESMLLHMLEKSGLSLNNTSTEEATLQNNLRALLQAEHQRNLSSIEVFRSSNRLPTIEEMNSVQIPINSRPDNQMCYEPEKGLVSVSQFSDRCISEPNGFYFKKSVIYEPDFISKSFDDVNYFGDNPNRLMNRLNFVSQGGDSDLHERSEYMHSPPGIRKIQSESKLGTSYPIQQLFLNQSKIKARNDQETLKSPNWQMERLRSFIQLKETPTLNKSKRGHSTTSISRNRESSFDNRHRHSISRTHYSKLSSVNADKIKDTKKLVLTLMPAPENIQTYTIIDKPKRSSSSDPLKCKIKGKSVSSANLSTINLNLQKKVGCSNHPLTSKDHQRVYTWKFDKIL